MPSPLLNPYSRPAGTGAHEPGGGAPFGIPAATVDAGRGASWIGEGWTLFRAAPLLWIVAMLVVWGIQIGLGLIPLAGALLGLFLGPVFVVGVLAFAHGIACGEEADIGKLFVGLQNKLGELVALAALYLALLLAVMVIGVLLAMVLLGGAGMLGAAGPEQAMEMAVASGGLLAILVVLLVVMTLVLLLAAAYWYAPGLVYFADVGAVEALQQSFSACMRNWLPFLVYSFLGFAVMLLGAAALGIGLLVALPVLMASYYASFRDLFGRAD